MRKLEAEVIKSYKQKWLRDPTLVSKAPGRVNIIGEHTDYTGGYVLPVAINRSIVFAVRASSSSSIRGYSLNYDQEASCNIGDYNPQHPAGWFRYVLGVLSELEKAGYKLTGFDFCIRGDIPIGSGLSSSAALEMAVLTAMEALNGFKLIDKEAALLCQRAENNFIGVKCGIMDMLVSRIGLKNHAIFIDCYSLSSHAIEMDLPGYSWLVIDSGKRRGLVESEYNKRRSECAEALNIARIKLPRKELKNLRDITLEDLQFLKKGMSQTVFRRIRHVVTENHRVLEILQAFGHKDLKTIGKLLYASHESLRYDFEVSCIELDDLVDIISTVDGVCGARLTGAGFGGCVILLARKQAIPEIRQAIKKRYHPVSTTRIKAKIFPIKVSDGVQVIFTG
jgi:galactokinase